MAIINKRTGYYGFTTDSPTGSVADNAGCVNKCIFAIVFPIQPTDVDFIITDGADDWGAQMGDGNIIPITNPKILYYNRDNVIVEYDMSVKYPSNSPCTLVYRSDTAAFNIRPYEGNRPFIQNSLSGHFGFTSEGYGGPSLPYGYVQRLVVSVPFPVQIGDVDFNITTDDSHWGARMGDGTIITLKNPEIASINNDNAVIKFDMDTSYPSNSPCIVVYRSADAGFSVKPSTAPTEFVPIQNITGVPTTLIAGVPFDLSSCNITPLNATIQNIDWRVVSGDAIINGTVLNTTGMGNVGIVAEAMNEDPTAAKFTKAFSINITLNAITIDAQPPEALFETYGNISKSISVTASSTNTILTYKWYRNNTRSYSGAIVISGEASNKYTIPANTAVGTYNYFCEVSSPGAVSVRSNITTVTVSKQLTAINITPELTTVSIGTTQKLSAVPTPSDIVLGLISWSSSDQNVAQVDKDGNLRVIGSGNATIMAKTIDGAFQDTMTITVAQHIPVTSIQNIVTSMDTETNQTLTGTAMPTTASNRSIVWSIVSDSGTNATLIGNILRCANPGNILMRATIANGAGPGINYTQDVTIKVNKKFVPVTDVTIETSDEIRAGESIIVDAGVVPSTATATSVSVVISDAGTTGAIIEGGVLKFTAQGTCKVICTVTKGKTPTTDFVKEITFTILPAPAQFIPVGGIDGLPILLEDVSKPLVLSGTIYPDNATNKNIVYSLKDASDANVVLSGNTITMDYEGITWWEFNENSTPPDHTDQWICTINNPIIIEARVVNGNSPGTDFVKDYTIEIQPPEAPDVVIGLQSVTLEMPSIIRAHRPLLMDRFTKEPWNANNENMLFTFYRNRDSEQLGFSLNFLPKTETHEYWERSLDLDMDDDEYDWTLDCRYVVFFEHIDCVMKTYVEKGNVDGSPYMQFDDITVLPIYLPIKNINNIPLSLPYNSRTLLYPEFDTQKQILLKHSGTYDLEIPSYTDTVWEVVSAGSTGAKITNGILSFAGTGNAIIRATIENGTKEDYQWYDKHNIGEAYTQHFNISVTGTERNYSTPVVKLTLDSGTIVNVNKVSELYNLSNNLPSDSYLEVGGQRFRKDQVTAVEFVTPTIVPDTINNPVTNITLSGNTLTKYTLPSGPSLLDFGTVTEATSNDGCTTITGNPLYDGWTRFPDKCFLNSDGTIVRHSNMADIILNNRYADNIFLVDPKYINFEATFKRYNNGSVEIPSGTIMDSQGNLYHGGFVYSIHGIKYTEVTTGGTTSAAGDSMVLPNESIIDASGNTFYVILPHGRRLDVKNLSIDTTNTYTGTAGIKVNKLTLETGCIFNVSIAPEMTNRRDDPDVSTLVKKIISNNSYSWNTLLTNIVVGETYGDRWLKMSSTGYITKDGFNVVNGIIQNVPSNQQMNLTTNATITPPNAHNAENIRWNKFIQTDPALGQVTLYAMTETDQILLCLKDNFEIRTNANIQNAFGLDTEYQKGFMINVGSPTHTGIVDINLDATRKNAVKQTAAVTISMTGTLLKSIGSSETGDIEWSVTNGVSGSWFAQGTSITRTGANTAELYISRREPVGKELIVTATCGAVSETCTVVVTSAFDNSKPFIGSLANFGYNFTNLISINAIPQTVDGDDCLRNFLKGCTSFNQAITIPSHIQGDRCLKGFLSDCTSFNQTITIPTGVAGTACLERFLSGCTSFNKPIIIPTGVTGEKCLMRFLEHCTSFNQDVTIPTNVSGHCCLDHFLFDCIIFNKPITIPDGLGGTCNLRGFMRNTPKMVSAITISEAAATNAEVNGLTLGNWSKDDAFDIGIRVLGTGATTFKTKCPNMIKTQPLRKFI